MTLQEFADFVRLCAVETPVPVEIHGAVMADDDRVRVRVRVGFEPKVRTEGEPQGVPWWYTHGTAASGALKAEREPDERLNVAVDMGADDLEALPVETAPQFVGDLVQELISRAVAEWTARRVSLAGKRLGTKTEAIQSPFAPIIARIQPEGVLATVGETIIWRARKLRVVRVDQDAGEIDLAEVRT